jgi:hypothetical protein
LDFEKAAGIPAAFFRARGIAGGDKSRTIFNDLDIGIFSCILSLEVAASGESQGNIS